MHQYNHKNTLKRLKWKHKKTTKIIKKITILKIHKTLRYKKQSPFYFDSVINRPLTHPQHDRPKTPP